MEQNQKQANSGAIETQTMKQFWRRPVFYVPGAIILFFIVFSLFVISIQHSKSSSSSKTGIVYDKGGKPGAASANGQPIKVGEYAYVNACNVIPFAKVSQELGGPGTDTIANETYAEASTAPAYTSDDGIEADCSYQDIGTRNLNYDLQLIETLSPDMAKAAQRVDKGTFDAMQPVPGLAHARYGYTHNNGDGVYGLVNNIFYKLSVADVANTSTGGQTSDPKLKAAIISMARLLEENIHTHKTGDSRATSTATQATTNGKPIVNDPCTVFSSGVFAAGIKSDDYIPVANRIPSASDINSIYEVNPTSSSSAQRYMTTCTRQTADTTNYGQERAGSASLSAALQDFTQPQNNAGATMTVNIATYPSVEAASAEMEGIRYLQNKGAQPISGYGDKAVYIPVASLNSSDHVSQLSVQKGNYIVDFFYFADQSLDFTHNKTAKPTDYPPFIDPLLARLPKT